MAHGAMDTFESPGMRKRAQTPYFPAVGFFDAETFRGSSRAFAALGGLGRVVRPVRRALQYHRYAFGPRP